MSTTVAALHSEGIKKPKVDSFSMKQAAFERLPDEIIQQ